MLCAIHTHRRMPPDHGHALISLVDEFGWYISAVLGRRIKQRWIELNPAEFELAQLCSQKLTAQIHSYLKTTQQCCQQVTKSLKKTRTTSNLSISFFKLLFYINIHDWGQLLYLSSHLLRKAWVAISDGKTWQALLFYLFMEPLMAACHRTSPPDQTDPIVSIWAFQLIG